MAEEIEGVVTLEETDGEQWEFYESKTHKDVTGWLEEAVRKRVGKPTGKVTSLESYYASGTCEVCGHDEVGIKLFVDGKEVYSDSTDAGGYHYSDDEYESHNLFEALQRWLNEGA